MPEPWGLGGCVGCALRPKGKPGLSNKNGTLRNWSWAVDLDKAGTGRSEHTPQKLAVNSERKGTRHRSGQ